MTDSLALTAVEVVWMDNLELVHQMFSMDWETEQNNSSIQS